MEVLVELELTQEEAEKLHIDPSSKLTFEELKRKMAILKLNDALEASHEMAKKYGIDKWTMDDIDQLIKEVREEDKKSHDKNSD